MNGELITKVKAKMHHAVRDDLLRYLQSSIKEKVEEEKLWKNSHMKFARKLATMYIG